MLEGPCEEAGETEAAQEGKPVGQQQTLPLWLEAAHKLSLSGISSWMKRKLLNTSCPCWPCLEPQYKGGSHRKMI